MNKRTGGSPLRYTLLIALVVLCAVVFFTMVSFQNTQVEPSEEYQPSELALQKATNQQLSLQIELLQEELATAHQKCVRPEPPEPKECTQPSSDSGKKDEVITNYDSLIFFQNYFNKYGEIRNKDKFPNLAPDFIPIVIRVFDKHEYLKFVLEYYRKVKGIEETILVISHDGIFPEVFKQVESIDFCQVKQIIHPYSGHTLTNRFPGKDPTLPHHVDQYGNPRPWPHTALKHHYWWHLNTAWDVLFPTHTGDIILMEEDHVPTADFYVSLKSIVAIRDKECPEECFNVQLHEHGVYASMSPHGSVHELALSGMFGNIGISFNRANFIKIKNAAKVFCEFDDYNWDWSTIHLQSKGILPKVTLVPVIPRAVHLGTCGTHFKGKACEINERDVQKVENYNRQIAADGGDKWDKYSLKNSRHLFMGQTKGYGGWAHPADHAHCMAQVKPNPNFKDKEIL